MRLHKLHLTRYGHFTNTTLDFGDKKAGKPDIHIVFGANEAGKTTLFNAWLDVLFGIEERSRYNFLHGYNTMQLGASLDTGGTTRTVSRIKARQNSLRDEQDNPLDNQTLLAHLYGLDRETLRMMFSLNKETLEKGGESILASEGELGQLLFSASSGLARFSQTLKTIRQKTDEFFIPQSRKKTELKETLQELKELKDRIKSLDMDAATYHHLVSERDQAQSAYETAREENNKDQLMLAILNRKKAALPHWQHYCRTLEQLETPEEGIMPSDSERWYKLIPSLIREEEKLNERLGTLEKRLIGLETSLKALPQDAAALAFQDRMGELEKAYSKDISASIDLPHRRQELFGKENDIQNLVKKLEQLTHFKAPFDPSDASLLLLNSGTVTRLRDLIESTVGLETRLVTARQENETALEHLEDALNNVSDQTTLSPEITSHLTRVLERIRNSSLRMRLSSAQHTRDKALDKVQEGLKALAPWEGTLEQLKILDLPDADTLQSWKQRQITFEKTIERQANKCQELANNKQLSLAKIHALKHVEGLLTPKERLDIRQERDKAWQTHKDALTFETATLFENSLHRDDLAGDKELHSAKSLATLAQLERDVLVCDSTLQQEEIALQATHQTYTAFMLDIHQQIAALLPDHNESPAISRLEVITRFETWLDLRKTVLMDSKDYDNAETAFADVVVEQNLLIEETEKAFLLAKLDIPQAGDWDSCLSRGDVFLEKTKKAKEHFDTIARLRHEKEHREKTLKICEKETIQWQKDWQDAQMGTWLEQSQAAFTPTKMRSFLDELPVLEKLIDESKSFKQRILDMEADRARFSEDVLRLAIHLNPTHSSSLLDKSTSSELWNAIKQRIQNAIAHERERLEKTNLFKDEQRNADQTKADWLTLIQQKEKILETCAVSSLEQAREKIEKLREYQRLEKEAQQFEQNALQALGVDSVDALNDALELLSREILQADIDNLDIKKNSSQFHMQDCFARLRECEAALQAVGGDNVVIKATTKYQTKLLELKEKTEYYFKQAAGVIAAEQALDLYRETHRSSMMKQASDAFCAISRGAYQCLTTRTDEDSKEVLVALATDGASKDVSVLSDGARAQLYLALRIAGFNEFAKIRKPLPFVADDILEPFDNERATETFKLLAKMSDKGQVIYLTHHQHLCALAQEIVPEVNLHYL